MLIILVGARGAGKSTLLENLKGSGVQVLQPSTSRPPRDAKDQEYDFVEADHWSPSNYAWSIDVNGQFYGMRRSELAKAKKKTCVTVFEPLNLHVFEALRKNLGIETITVGLNTITDPIEQRRRVAAVASRIMSEEDLEKATAVVAQCDLVLSGDAATINNATQSLIDLVTGRGGVLTRGNLEPLVKAGALLTEAELKNIQEASYDLSIGSEILFQGKTIILTDAKPRFELPPYSYAVVSAREHASLPPCVIGRFDLKVSYFFEGIILSNGPQVDPGYKGALFCMLYNGSGQAKVLKLGNTFATIDFTTTTTVTAGYKEKYQFKNRIGQFLTDNAVSSREGIVDVVDRKVRVVDSKVKKINASFWAIAAISVALPALTVPIMWNEISVARSERIALEKTQLDAQELLKQARSERDEAARLIQARSPMIEKAPEPRRPPAPDPAPNQTPG